MDSLNSRLEYLSSLSQGNLAEYPYSMILAALEKHQRTGVLEIERKPIEKRLVFQKGAVVQCSSNLVHETFGRFLVSQGVINEDEGHAALSESLKRGIRFGEFLLEKKRLTPSVLFRHLQVNLGRKILDPFTWSEGSFHLSLEPIGDDSPLKVKVPQLILTGLLKLGTLAEPQNGLAPYLDQKFVLDPKMKKRLSGLRLPGKYAQITRAFAQPMALTDLLVATRLSPAEVMKITWALALVGVIASTDDVGDWANSAEPSATQTVPTHESQAPIDAEKTRNRIMKTYLAYQRQDAFDLFGLKETADLEAIDNAWVQFAQGHAPWGVLEEKDAALREKAKLIFLRGSESYAELRGTESRNTLLFRRKTLRDEGQKKSYTEKIKTDLLDPRVQYQNGIELLEKGEESKALELLQFASDCDPQNGLYKAEAAWCRHLVHPSKKESILEDLEASVTLSPTSGEAWLRFGEMLLIAGSLKDSERALRQSNKLLAPDRRPIEALKRLKVAKTEASCSVRLIPWSQTSSFWYQEAPKSSHTRGISN